MVNFYTAKDRFRRDLRKTIERMMADETVNTGDGRLLLARKDIEEINGIVMIHGFSKRVLKNELDLLGLTFDEEKSCILIRK